MDRDSNFKQLDNDVHHRVEQSLNLFFCAGSNSVCLRVRLYICNLQGFLDKFALPLLKLQVPP